MSNNISLKEAGKIENQSFGGGRKTSSLRPPEKTLKCPRCDSTNTKFCYYNNYNLTQPRHFCKTCRRYWTKGGALRNIPIGGGCRKSKKTKSCSSKFISGDSSSENGGLKLLDGLYPPAMDFHLTGVNYPPRINQFSSSYGHNTTSNLPFMNLDPLGFSFPKGDHNNQTGGGLANIQEVGFTYTNLQQSSSLASSIESLSSLNQDLHWKLQQQRLAMLFGGSDGSVGNSSGENNHHRQHQNESGLQPILFQNLEIPRKDGGRSGDGGVGGLATEWFFDDNYAPVNVNPAATGNDQHGHINNWNGIEAWDHMNQYSALP